MLPSTAEVAMAGNYVDVDDHEGALTHDAIPATYKPGDKITITVTSTDGADGRGASGWFAQTLSGSLSGPNPECNDRYIYNMDSDAVRTFTWTAGTEPSASIVFAFSQNFGIVNFKRFDFTLDESNPTDTTAAAITESAMTTPGLAETSTPSPSVQVGDEICIEGFVMDSFCIGLGFLLDNPSVTTLKNPELHSVHCLVDVPPCVNSPFEILVEPQGDGELYSRGYRLSSNEKLVELAREAGKCSTCSGMGDQHLGFRAEVIGTVTSLAMSDTPPVLDVSYAGVLHAGASPCRDFNSHIVDPNLEEATTSTISTSATTTPNTVEIVTTAIPTTVSTQVQ